MSRSFPWYPWYPANFLSATRGWSILQRGGYHECLDAQWELDGLPGNPEDIRRVINATAQDWRRIWPTIASKFPISDDGKRRNPRLEYERSRGHRVSELRAELGRIGAQKRWKADGYSYGNSHAEQAQAAASRPDGNSHAVANGKTMPSTPTPTSTVTSTGRDQNSEATSSRKRARSASPMGSRARADAVIDESDPAVRKRRRDAERLTEEATRRCNTSPSEGRR